MGTRGILLVGALALASPLVACADASDGSSTAATGGEEGVESTGGAPGGAGAPGVGGAGGADANGGAGNTVVPSAGLRLMFRTHDSAETVGQLSIQLLIMADEEVPLSEVFIRYWYTPDGATNQVLDADVADMGTANVTATFGDDHVEIGFTEGTIPAGGQQELQFRIYPAGYDSRYTLTNDWSYSPDADAYMDWDRITIYRNGQLVFGVEPT